MHDKLRSEFVHLTDRFLAYFPQLLAGLSLLGCGLVLAWFVKRLVVRLAVILKFENILIRARWRVAFQKADVRYGFYNFLGNIVAFIIFLTFLDFAFSVWDLKMLSDTLGDVIFIFPRFLAAAVIFAMGWLIARWAANALSRTLRVENVPYASGIAHYAQLMLLVLFAAMSLVELDIAHEIVLIGFTIMFIMLGAIAVIMTIVIGKRMAGSHREPTAQETISENKQEQ